MATSIKRCSKCNQEAPEQARFCQICGTELATTGADSAWVAGMQEEIKSVRHDKYVGYIICTVVGIIVVIAGFVLGVWAHSILPAVALAIVGLILLLTGAITPGRGNIREKKLTKQLKSGRRS